MSYSIFIVLTVLTGRRSSFLSWHGQWTHTRCHFKRKKELIHSHKINRFLSIKIIIQKLYIYLSIIWGLLVIFPFSKTIFRLMSEYTLFNIQKSLSLLSCIRTSSFSTLVFLFPPSVTPSDFLQKWLLSITWLHSFALDWGINEIEKYVLIECCLIFRVMIYCNFCSIPCAPIWSCLI